MSAQTFVKIQAYGAEDFTYKVNSYVASLQRAGARVVSSSVIEKNSEFTAFLLLEHPEKGGTYRPVREDASFQNFEQFPG